MDSKGRLLKACAEVEKSLELDEKPTGSPQKALRAVFDFNREIGRVAKEEPTLAPRLVELQVAVNEVTKSIKAGRLGQARDGLREAKKTLDGFVRSD